ncbi:aminopeptidase [Tumebacillus sp. BK434]|uniref:aminopeptidase n=1 Tax=Tumebacillus sp. BK434 TaxID=2512169 RepID=UPI00104E407D|nr:aminopeptidase [Tumebacillus sp. BK434]
MTAEQLRKYAELAVRQGINVQPGQKVIVRAPVEAAAFAREVVKQAYAAGANHVWVDWSDEDTLRTRLELAPEETLELVPEGYVRDFVGTLEEGGAMLGIYAPKPGHLSGLDAARIGKYYQALGKAMRRQRDLQQASKSSWSMVMIPTPEWAAIVFPELSPEAGMTKLWDSIRYITGLDQEDPIAYWQQKVEQIESRAKWLTDEQFLRLHYSGGGTELSLELPRGHIWVGGRLTDEKGTKYLPNIPTEEVFSAPLRTGVNGVVKSTFPLEYSGQLIEGITIKFQDGRIVEASAEKGDAVLQEMISADDSAQFLGEVALVPQDSPISNLNIVFRNTLFDENASCHFALGSAYPLNLKGGQEMTREQLAEHGLNTSIIHVDFMIGSAELDIDGEREDGTRVPLFRNGNWA